MDFRIGILVSAIAILAGFNLYGTTSPKIEYPALEKHSVDGNSVTISGLSNGAAFSVHLSFILSSVIKGAGIFAGSPYPMVYRLLHGDFAMSDMQGYYNHIDKWSENGHIDPTTNLNGFKAYVFRGKNDTIVPTSFLERVVEQFTHYGAIVKNAVNTVEAGHCMPTDNSINNIAKYGWLQGIRDEGFDGIFDMFLHLYGDSYVTPLNSSIEPTGNLSKFDFAEFFPDGNAEMHGLSNDAWIYIPKTCRKAGGANCKLHLAFHGYLQPFRARWLAGGHSAFVENAGYLQVADSNNVIIIFPEANLRGYDIFGYTGRNSYVLKSGIQPAAILKMIQRIVHGT